MQFSSSTSTGSRMRYRLGMLALVALSLLGCREKTPVILGQLDAFDARIDVNLVGVTQEQARQATAIIAQDFSFLQDDWTAGHSGQLERVNRLLATQTPFVAPPSLMPLLERSKTYEAQSEGLFNPAIGKLMDLWGFQSDHPGDHRPPTAASIAQLVTAAPSLSQVEIRGLMLQGHNPAIKLDFRPIARSLAIDIAMQHLMDLGVRNALIQAESELRAIGDRSGQPWRIPVRRASGSAVFAILSIRGDESVVTRATYERNFMFKGRLYHAIIDPRTGRPAEGARAVTVVANAVSDAAAAASALFIAGPGEWPRIAERMGVRYVVLVDAAGRVQMTQAMADRIELVDTNEEILVPSPALPGTLASGERTMP